MRGVLEGVSGSFSLLGVLVLVCVCLPLLDGRSEACLCCRDVV